MTEIAEFGTHAVMLSGSRPFGFSQSLIDKSAWICFALVYLALSLWALMSMFIGSAFFDDNGVPPVVQHRPLVPVVVQALDAVIPETLEQTFTPVLQKLRDSAAGQKILSVRSYYQHEHSGRIMSHISDDQLFYTTLKMLVVYATEWLFIWMLYRLGMELFPASRACALFSPIAALLVVSAFAKDYAYSFDFAELFFSCAFLYVLLKERFGLYFLLLMLGTLNKETTLFGMFFFAVWFFARLPRKEYLALLGAQVLLYVAIRYAVIAYYNNQHSLYYFAPLQNLLALYGFSYQSIVALCVSLLLVTYRWSEKPLFLRYGLWMVVPNVGAYILTCNPHEYRDLYWCLPPMLLLATHTLVELAGVGKLPIFARNTLAG